ncbi:MAG: glycogen synthase [Aggregatilineales bacterium]
MNILFTTAEAYPFAKVGGLADVVGSLPAALRQIGVDARVIMPGYGFINHEKFQISHLFSFKFTHHEGTSDVNVYSTVRDGVPFYFVQSWPYFGDDTTVYTEWNWDSPRFIFFNQLTMATAWELRERLGWFPDVFHANDWHTGLVPFLVAENRWKQEWSHVSTMLSIHNLMYQGDFMGGYMWKMGIPGRNHPDLVYQDLTNNTLAIAIAYSDIVSTVSPRYAIEIQYPYMGYGLDGMIRTRISDLYGILNGIDNEVWNPETDPRIIKNYTIDNFHEHRIENKRYLQRLAGLQVNDSIPLISFVSRLVWQKGIDLALPALRQLLAEADVQLIMLGTGDPDLEYALWRLGQDFPGKVRAYLEFDAAVAQQIYAGCDIFLMPSHFEPCGIGQMSAMRYGALPLVRETGGLADTVENYDNGDGERGTGFTFEWEKPEAVLGTMRWAIQTFRERPDVWQRMQRRAMQRDFSWKQSAERYASLYRKLIDSRRG